MEGHTGDGGFGDGDDNIYIMMKWLSVTKNDHFFKRSVCMSVSKNEHFLKRVSCGPL